MTKNSQQRNKACKRSRTQQKQKNTNLKINKKETKKQWLSGTKLVGGRAIKRRVDGEKTEIQGKAYMSKNQLKKPQTQPH